MAWAIICVLALVLDVATSAYILFPFGLGALAALVASWLGAPGRIQIPVFLVTAAIIAAAAYPLVRRFLKKSVPHYQAEDDPIGRTLTLSQELYGEGSIQLVGAFWTAINQAGHSLPAGTKVIVTGREGNRLLVNTLKEER